MNREIQELLAQMQSFAQKAVEELQKGNNERASFFFNVVASNAGKLAELSKGK
jgi:hypothetical protein